MLSRIAFAALIAGSALAVTGCSDDAGSVSDTTPPNDNMPPDDPPPGFEEADPGRVTIHRLNRAEYNNSVRDLLGTDLRPADDFPSDDHGYGFDNIADVLSISPLQLELYDRAAELLATEALLISRTDPEVFAFEAETVGSETGAVWRDEGWNLWSNGQLDTVIEVPQTGDYQITVRAFGQQAGDEPARMTVALDGVVLETFDVTAVEFADHTLTSEIQQGPRTISVAFINDFYEPDLGQDRNLIVDAFEITGPLGLTGEPNPIRERLMVCEPRDGADADCAGQILGTFARKAWRRPVQDDEVERLVALAKVAWDDGDTFDAGISLGLQGILLSPHFIYRVELDPDPDSETPHKLTEHELAVRLSYFLWSSTPDETLLALADEGALSDDAEMARQVERMLADPRSDALVENFSGQWLHTNALNDIQPDYNAFPDYDDELKEALIGETRMFFREFLDSDRPASEMFTAEFTYINDRLAQHYDMPAVDSDELVRMELSDGQRGGILTHGSVLTVTSYPTRTSPVLRGKWILTQLLCSEPGAPPDGVEGLVEENIPTGTLRERLEQHRADPTCASCHDLMDPLGFGLEKFDGIGAWRDEEFGFPIDDSGILDDGTEFEGARELSHIIQEDERFADCLSKQMFIYALGRGAERHDTDDLALIREQFKNDGQKIKDLARFIASSHAFQFRRGEANEEGE